MAQEVTLPGSTKPAVCGAILETGGGVFDHHALTVGECSNAHRLLCFGKFMPDYTHGADYTEDGLQDSDHIPFLRDYILSLGFVTFQGWCCRDDDRLVEPVRAGYGSG